MHPKAAAMELSKAAIKDGEENKRRNLELWTKDLHLRFVHVRGFDESDDGPNIKGGLTIAYSLPKLRYKRIVPVSVAIVHDNDTFCKRTGRYHAAQNFYNGKTIDIRIPKDYTPATFIKALFNRML